MIGMLKTSRTKASLNFASYSTFAGLLATVSRARVPYCSRRYCTDRLALRRHRITTEWSIEDLDQTIMLLFTDDYASDVIAAWI